MFKVLKREAIAEFELIIRSPFITGGKKNSSIDPTSSDITTLESRYSPQDSCPVLPGSSIKGVFRSAVSWERIMKNCSENVRDDLFVIDLFGRADKDEKQKSKIAFHDAFIREGYKTAVINSNAVDPLVQSTVRGALFNYEPVISGTFEAGFKMINFNKEELISIMDVIDKINFGSVRFGAKSARGFGKMKIGQFSFTFINGYNEDLEPRITKYNSIPEINEAIERGDFN